ncbi:putative B6 ABC transporter ATP-binding protein [Rhodospirillaceae bacterium SYSU D60014]|uniref:putative B6 ABC transporter ATP-binding protein n=1 Tax=Virgifigura deserti TaxID=2268457 RepID=UPI000E65F25A
MDASTAGPNGIAISLSDVTKRFPGVLANDRVSLTFRHGEIHALLGENGAGKSTLISIIAGMQQPDEGTIAVGGATVRLSSPRDALKLGIGTVYQHVLLIPSLTILENLMLGSPWWRRCDPESVLPRFRELSKLLSVQLDPDALVGRLSLGEQQQVEIMRALWHGERALILDEPTSMLTPDGVKELSAVVRRLRDHGVAVIFITHKLREAYELADHISVLRLGHVVGELPKERLGKMTEKQVIDEVITMMFGRNDLSKGAEAALVGTALDHDGLKPVDRSGSPALALHDVSTTGQFGECALNHVSFDVWPGEIFGVAGVDGNGQKHLAEVLSGQRPVSGGTVMLNQKDVTRMGVPARRAHGVRYITDERLDEGTAGTHSVSVNLVLKETGKPPFWRNGITRWGVIHGHARTQIEAYDVRTPSEHTPIAKLSGGNIQKVLLARELSPDAKLVIFNKPTYGLDIQSTKLARDRIRRGAGADNAVVIVISTELDELMETCHRIAVMDRGELRGIVDNRKGAETEIGLLMTGARVPAHA